MGAMLCILAFAAGSCVRDGWPSLGTTHGARALGALCCALGALCVFPLEHAAIIGGGVLAGFYGDQRHGEGQQARDLRDAGFLILSGVTSVLPLALLMGLVTWDARWAALIPVGVVKPLFWFPAWEIRPDRWHPWLEPTRVSAIAFGGALGAAVAVL
jgi:hypothetical protein